ncbi:MAG: hypothetical protein QOG62_2505 [Thermoleophilaceae bacterium]|nr:hypothetical protein [Thermoleophilaceae bacterium]
MTAGFPLAVAPTPAHLVALFFLAVAVIMLTARLAGLVAVKLGQPRVMGEVIAGITLGPTLFGRLFPEAQAALFPPEVVGVIGVVANLGLVFYMFLVGLELDFSLLQGRVRQAVAISNASVALPMVLGLAVAIPLYPLLGTGGGFLPFALFMGVAMSITAFPVLARILVERRMLDTPVGTLVLACAAIDDVTAWFLIAVALAIAGAGSGLQVLVTIGLAIVFCLVMWLVVRPVLSRMSTAYQEVGRVPSGWIVAIFAGVLLSAFATETIGIAVIFGAFVMGLVMPRNDGLTEDVTGRIEDFVAMLLLPLFFTFTGLRTDVGLISGADMWAIAALLLAIAIVGKLFGAAIAARLTGMDWRSSAVVGILMNTRGLTELIVLNLALDKGVISQQLFTMLVIMALITTLMAGPALRLLDRRRELSAGVGDELEVAAQRASDEAPGVAVPERSILVASQSGGDLAQLLAVAEPLARSKPPRELVIARLLRPTAGAQARGGLQTEARRLDSASDEMAEVQRQLAMGGSAARAVAIVSGTPGRDLVRLSERQDVDLVLIEGRRPLLGSGVPRGEVSDVLRSAPSDVAVLVAREGVPVDFDRSRPVMVPFGGAEHDWGALELGAWLAAATDSPLQLVGAAPSPDEFERVNRMLADASALVRGSVGVAAEPVVTEPGQAAILAAADGAAVLVIGLSERWRREGLGPTRSAIARGAAAPVLFLRRGSRQGALASRAGVTQFGWSVAGAGPG